VVFFFPIQLLWIQLKKSQTVLIFWLLLFLYITRSAAYKYGIPHLFLYPEYLGKVSFLSHLIVGFSCGVFIMSYNISTYIINGFRFPFIATLSRPFVKFCYNNSLIPWVFTITYIYNIYDYQANIELVKGQQILTNVLGFLSGNVLFIAFSTLYFITTNKTILSFLTGTPNKKKKERAVKDFIHRPSRWDKLLNRQSRWRIETYLSNPIKIALARSSTHYDRETINKVFSQNHINASFFEIACVLAILLIGWFKEVDFFIIPASASLFLLFSIILMLASAVHSWVKGWALTFFILLFVGLHYATTQDWISFDNKAYGLNYTGNKANYSEEFLRELARNKFDKSEDIARGIEILENWKDKTGVVAGEKPKMIILNASGGGLRSMMWTTLSLLRMDEALDGKLMKHMHLITGSSGGMIGASYVRELYLHNLQPESFEKEISFLSEKISRDVLNPVALNLVAGDMIFNYQTFEDGPYTYKKDRAYAFEKTLNANVSGLFDKRLRDYVEPEYNAEIPMMIFSPTIINDARRLIISAQPVSYMMNNVPQSNVSGDPLIENIEFQKFFAEQDASNIKYTSILRMSATFPYILPSVALPSKPQIKIMDSGIRDNYGLTATLKYLYTFRNWISENTSGVIILQLRDKFKRYEAKSRSTESLMGNLTSPLDNFYSNWTNVQTFEQDQLLQYASSWFNGTIEVLPFQLKNDPSQRISLSWHLTNSEKELIMKSLYISENQLIIEKLKGEFNKKALLVENN
jgi:hypothetical protein